MNNILWMKLQRKKSEKAKGEVKAPSGLCWLVTCADGFEGVIESITRTNIIARWKLENPDHRDVVSVDPFTYTDPAA